MPYQHNSPNKKHAIKVQMVELAHAAADPETMMIERPNAYSALPAVLAAPWLSEIADVAPSQGLLRRQRFNLFTVCVRLVYDNGGV